MSHFLITGHTGFKGSWLTLLLTEMGHHVSGLALDPEVPSLFDSAAIRHLLEHDIRLDIREREAVSHSVLSVRPDVVVHLAAQPLVRLSYERPRETIEVNVMGTLNLLEAVASAPTVQASLIVTTDKVYRPREIKEPFKEADPLGGEDIYSASKTMADVLTAAWVGSFGGPPTAIARAGNVIGGGDFGHERLIPDLVRSVQAQEQLELRYPEAVRPWQHVLDCLAGYLTIIEDLTSGKASAGVNAWNIGPDPSAIATVAEVVEQSLRCWGKAPQWDVTDSPLLGENPWLSLDSDLIRRDLGWRDRLDLDASISWTADWYQRVSAGEDPRTVSAQQVRRFLELTQGPSH